MSGGAPGCIPRSEMPQVKDAFLLASHLHKLSVPLHFDWFEPAQLRGRQRVRHGKIRSMREADLLDVLVVSHEPIIIDGNHRWFFAHYHRLPVRLQALVIRLPFEEALQRVRECLSHASI